MNKILNHLKTISWFFIFPFLVLIIYLILMLFLKIYLIFPWYDIPVHIIGGASLAITYFLTLQYFQKEKYLDMNGFFEVLFIFALVSLTAIFWELFEFFVSYLTGWISQGDLQDTMADLFFGMLGGLFTAVFLESQVKRYFKLKQSL